MFTTDDEVLEAYAYLGLDHVESKELVSAIFRAGANQDRDDIAYAAHIRMEELCSEKP